MKPNADMITKILHNFRVNGKFDQDRLIIGRGVDEQLQLMLTDTIGIRYVPNNGSNPKLEYTNDGTTWYEFEELGSVSLTYEPIEFDQSHLSSDGKITIQHNFNDKNVLCLGYTPRPKEIEYLDNQLVLDYSDQNGSNFTGAVWFVNSTQSMLAVPEPKMTFSISNCRDTSLEGVYEEVPKDQYTTWLYDADDAVAAGWNQLYTNGVGLLLGKSDGTGPIGLHKGKVHYNFQSAQYVVSGTQVLSEITTTTLLALGAMTPPVPTITRLT